MSLEARQPGPEESRQRADAIARRIRLGIVRPTPKPATPPRAALPDPGPTREPVPDLPAVVVAAPEEVVEDIKPAPITLHRIVGMVSAEFGVTVRQIRSQGRSAHTVAPRQAIAYLARQLTVHSFKRIGQLLGRRDHSTVHTAERRARKRMMIDHEFALAVVTVERRLIESAARYVMADVIIIDGRPVDHLECPHCQRVVIEAKRGA